MTLAHRRFCNFERSIQLCSCSAQMSPRFDMPSLTSIKMIPMLDPAGRIPRRSYLSVAATASEATSVGKRACFMDERVTGIASSASGRFWR